MKISKRDVRSAKKIADIDGKVKEIATAKGLDRNQSALLAIANETTPEAQQHKARELASRKRPPRHKPRTGAAVEDSAFESLKAAWANAPDHSRKRFIVEVLGVDMDRVPMTSAVSQVNES